MWTKSYSIITDAVTKEQMWALFADINNWNKWDPGIDYTKMEGQFEKGNHFILKPKGGPEFNVDLIDVIPCKKFVDVTKLPLARMYDEHLFEETPDGLKITNTISVKGILWFIWVMLVAGKLVKAIPEDIKSQIKAGGKL